MIPKLTWGADFAGLVRYLVQNRDHEVLDLQGVSSVHFAADEMAAVSSLNARATNKLLHLSLSAAHEDGRLADDQWLHAVDRVETTLGLKGHLRVVVRHLDKAHDHVHAFWCTISTETAQTPPKQWFLKRGCAVRGIGPHALSETHIAMIPTADRARRSYDFRALARCQDTCRQVERELELRQLRTPTEAAQARRAGRKKAGVASQRKRAERVGSMPLTDRADEIRSALDIPDWPSKRRAMAALGLDFEPTFRNTKTGPELRGLVVFDVADPGNRVKASQFDTPARKYGIRRLEERHDAGAMSLEAWWPVRERVITPASSSRYSEAEGLKESFSLLLEKHRFVEREKRKLRKALRKKLAKERARKQSQLMALRRAEASRLPPAHRRAFYKRFAATVRAPELAALAKRHKNEAAEFARARAPRWSEYVTMCTTHVSHQAAAQLNVPNRRAPEVSRVMEGKMPDVQNLSARPLEEPVRKDQTQSPEAAPSQDLHAEYMLRAYREFQARGR